MILSTQNPWRTDRNQRTVGEGYSPNVSGSLRPWSLVLLPMRAIWKTLAVGAVIAVLGTADSIEMYAVGGALLLALPFVVWRIDRRRRVEEAVVAKAATTLDVIPLPRPAALEDDIEGKTVRAP